MKRTPVVCSLLVFAATMHADDSRRIDAPREKAELRAAWDYSDSERLAKRFDVASIRERASRDATEPYGMRSRVATNVERDLATLPNIIIGRRNPELFLPYELFVELVHASLIEERTIEIRNRLAPIIRTTMEPSTFWSRLEAASAPYTALLRREREFAAQLQNAGATQRPELLKKIATLQEPQCAARADALNAAAAAVGKATLFRVLYEGIAPTMAITSSPQLDADQMKFIAGGCR